MSLPALRPQHRPRLWLALWGLALLATLVVCLLPLPAVAMPLPQADKLEHLLAYALLSAYAVMLFEGCVARRVALAGLVLFGLGIEGLQSLLPWRSAEWPDVLANALGVSLGALVATPLSDLLAALDRRLFGPRG